MARKMIAIRLWDERQILDRAWRKGRMGIRHFRMARTPMTQSIQSNGIVLCANHRNPGGEKLDSRT